MELFSLEATRRQEFTLNMLPKATQGNLLEIGCYEGTLAKSLEGRFRYTGLDIQNQLKDSVPFIQCDLNQKVIPVADATYDVVVCTQVLEHLFYPLEVLHEIARILKKDGYAVLSFPNNGSATSLLETRRKRFLPYEAQVPDHHWFFTHESSRSFVRKVFEIREERNYFVKYFPKSLLSAGFRRIIPESVENWLLKVAPRQVAGNIFFLVQKSEN